MEVNMKNANKRLLISIAALVISIALAATTTFAWFTMDTTPEINDIDLNVTAQDGLYISESNDEGDFYTNITVKNESPDLDAVTVKDHTDLTQGFITIKDGTTVTEDASTDYYSKTIYIRSQSQYNVHVNNVTITGDETTTQNIYAWADLTAADLGLTGEALDVVTFPEATDAAGTGAASDPYEADDILVPKNTLLPSLAVIENAIRVGFAVEDVMVHVYERDESAGWGAYSTSYNAAHDYFKTVTAMSAGDQTTFDATWANPGYSDILFDQTKLATTAGFTEDNLILGTIDGGNPVGGLTAPGADGWYTAEIEIYIWAEGCDPDCFNELLKDSFTVSIELSGNYVPTT